MSRKPSKGRDTEAFSEADFRLLAAFRFQLREFLRFSELAARAAGVRPQQHQAMLVIRGAPGGHRMAIGELAARLKVRHHSAVELVNRMESERLVEKGTDPRDGRRVLLTLTKQGERALKSLSATHKAELARVGPVLKDILTHLHKVL